MSSSGWVLDPETLARVLRSLDFREETIGLLSDTAQRIASDSGNAQRFREFASAWAEGRVREPTGELHGLWDAVAVVAAFPGCVADHQARRVPRSITAATLQDLQRRMDDYGQRFGHPGFDRLAWMRNHVTGRIFEIGRLQFMPGVFRYPFRVYQDAQTGRDVALAHAGLSCTPEGWPEDGAGGFVTEFSADEDVICGHSVDADTGAIVCQRVRIPADARLWLDAGTPVIHIHIPAGEKMSPEDCRASFNAARAFFQSVFPGQDWQAFCCQTWLLDRALEAVLPKHANILAFGRFFHPLAVRNADERQHVQRIFGEGADWRNFAVATSLQKNAQAFLAGGGRFRLLSGYRSFVPGRE